MADEPQAGTVSADQAMMLLLLDGPAELKKLERAGAFRPMAPGRYRLVDIVQGFCRHVRKAEAPAPVSSAALAAHLSCVPSYVRKLVEQGVIERRADGRFDLDQCRAKYIAHIRAERKLSPRSEADADFQRSKTELIKLRIAERKQELIPRTEAAADMERMIGLFLTGLGNLSSRCGGRDLAVRRAIDKTVFELRTELAGAVTAWADEAGEPPLEDAA